MTAESLELIAIMYILVWIHKVYIDILFFFCARNLFEMNFSQNISNSELVCFADCVPPPTTMDGMDKANTIRY